jgi:hypothetical protein
MDPMKVGLVLAAVLAPMILVQGETAPDGVAAKVNGDLISKADLDEQVDSWFNGSDLTGDQLRTARDERRKVALRALIERELILQAFRNEGEQIPAGMLDMRLDGIIAENYGGDRNAFLSTIKERGVTLEKYRQDIADNWIINHMRQKHPAPGWSHSLLSTADITIY